MVYGRGGAGNITQAKEATKRGAEDLEANNSTSSASVAAPTTSSTLSNQPPSEYAHMGRGGAGNWYQPTSLAQDGTFTSSSTSDDATAAPTSDKPQISTPWHPEAQEMPLAKAGRGGAGNFVWGEAEKERVRKVEEEKKSQALSEGVERDVELGLQKPGQAVFAGEKAGRGW